jgi:signal transduction histidine kinase
VEELDASGVQTEFSTTGEPEVLSPEAQLALYRTAQEGLTNVRRHARASRVRVQLHYENPARVRLTVEDDGVGATSPDGGFGLLGVRERVQLLDGQMRMETAPREGFKLDVEVPR